MKHWAPVDWDERVAEKTKGKFAFVSREVNEAGESTLTVKCTVCGTFRTISSISLRHSKKSTCKGCLEIKRKAEKEQRQYEQQQRELTRFINKKRVQMSMPLCKCGRLAETGRTCNECKRQALRTFEKRKELIRHGRIKNFGHIDKDITLERLYDRDGGVCYICGCSCNWNDYTRNDKGAFIVGVTYPTIEHVKPLSKGGGHVWENVRLACWTCNTNKGVDELAAI